MAQLQKGTTYSAENNTVDATNLNAHVDAAILLVGAVSSQSALSAAPASDDAVLISDTDAAALKKVTTTELLSTEVTDWVGKGASGGTAALQINGVDMLSIDSSGDTTVAGTLTCDDTVEVTGVTTLSDHVNLLTEKELRFQDAEDSEYVGIKAPETVTATHTLTLPATVGAAGTVLKASDGAGALEWGTPGKVLQVVYADITGSTFNTTSGTMTDVTGFSCAITPTSDTSTILVQCMISGGAESGNYVAYGLTEKVGSGSAAQIGSATGGTGNQRNAIASMGKSDSDEAVYTTNLLHKASPATTEEVLYQLTVSNRTVTTDHDFYLNRPKNATDDDWTVYCVSSITLTEIAG